MKVLLMLGCLIACLAYTLLSCSRDDGLPDPPLRMLVPCHADASADDPLACPPPVSMNDGGASAD